MPILSDSRFRAFTSFCLLGSTLSLLLLPAIPTVAGVLPSLRMDDLLSAIWLVIALISAPRCLTPPSSARLLLLALIIPIIPLSMIAGLLHNYSPSPYDLIQILRVIKYLVVYAMATQYFISNNVDRFLILSQLFGVFLFFLCLSQYFDIFKLNEFYVRYIAPTQYTTLINNYPSPRVVGMIGNPNELGFALAILIFMAMWLWERTGGLALFYAVPSVLGILMTGSRTSAIAAVIGAVMLAFGRRFRARITIPVVVLALLVGLGIFLLLHMPTVHVQTANRMATIIKEPATTPSVTVRFDEWSKSWELFKHSVTFGLGPLHRAGLASTDNEWILLLRSYGIIGTIVYILFWLIPLRWINSNSSMLAIAVTVSTFVYMIPANAFNSVTLFPLLLIFLAAIDYAGRAADLPAKGGENRTNVRSKWSRRFLAPIVRLLGLQASLRSDVASLADSGALDSERKRG